MAEELWRNYCIDTVQVAYYHTFSNSYGIRPCKFDSQFVVKQLQIAYELGRSFFLTKDATWSK